MTDFYLGSEIPRYGDIIILSILLDGPGLKSTDILDQMRGMFMGSNLGTLKMGVGQDNLAPGTYYPLLTRLCDEGLIEAFSETGQNPEKDRNRKYRIPQNMKKKIRNLLNLHLTFIDRVSEQLKAKVGN